LTATTQNFYQTHDTHVTYNGSSMAYSVAGVL